MKSFYVSVLFSGLLLSFIFPFQSSAQESGLPHYYLAGDCMVSGFGWTNLNGTDFAVSDATLNVGYRFDNHWAVYVPVRTSVLMSTIKTDKRYEMQETLGVGGAYQFNFKQDSQYIQLALSGSSTVANRDIDYFRGDFKVRWGGRRCCAGPYLGLGLVWLSPYDGCKDKLLIGLDIGIALF